MNIMTVSQQWSSRPDDQRFLTLDDLYASVSARTEKAEVQISDTKMMRLHSAKNDITDALVVSTELGPKMMTNWTFGQLCSNIHAPAGYLRTLPPALVETNVNHGLMVSDKESIQLMANSETDELRAITSPTYGRIWDKDVVNAILDLNDRSNNRWKIPAASYAEANPKRATTLYASDRDVFVFLCDPDHPVTVNGDVLFRGFYAWNSEVGSKTFGLATFLYNRVCDNRIIWGATEYKEFKIKHTSGAPDRFIREAAPMLKAYSESSVQQIEQKIVRAQNIKLGKDKEEVQDFLKKFGFTASAASDVMSIAQAEEGKAETAWDLAQGITAKARSLVHSDARVEMEKQAGRLLDKVLGTN